MNAEQKAAPFATRTADVAGLRIGYDERVLEPRPWTALQGIWAAQLAAHLPPGPMLELCSGVGHIGLVALSRCDRHLVQVDSDATACRFARTNAAAAGLSHRVEVRHRRLETMAATGEVYPLVLADPPYLPSGDAHRFPNDPEWAIDGGDEGLDVVAACLTAIGAVLAPGGCALLQLGREDHVDRVRSMTAHGLVVTDHKADRADRHIVLLQRERAN